MPRPPRWSETDKDEMVRRYEGGESRLSIGKAMGSKSPTVTRILKERGIALRAIHPHKLTPTQEHAVARRYAAGEDVNALVDEYQCTIETIRRIVRRAGGTIRPLGGQVRSFTDAEIGAIRDMTAQRMSQTAIAQALGTTQSMVSTLMTRHNIPTVYGYHAKGDRHGSWKGGRTIGSGGYVSVRIAPGDSYSEMASTTGYVLEHRLVMARYLGRPLYAWETVHHIDDRDKTNNDIANLQLRIGKHGKYAAYRCMDCGSTRLEPVLLE